MTAPADLRGNAAKRIRDTSTPPWKKGRWLKMSRHGRAIKFIETYCRAPKGIGFGKPLKLGGFQKEFLEEALAPGVDTAILETPRGNGKSSGGGAFAVWALFDDDDTGAPQVPIIATTVQQAVRSCYGVAAAMVSAEPELINRALIYTGIATPRIVFPFNGGEAFPISNDVVGLQGLDPSFGIVDEIGFQPTESWDALQLAQGKRFRSLIMGLGTPGVDHENALWQLRTLVREGADLPGVVFHEYATPSRFAIDDPEGWRIGNPAIAAGFLQESALERALARTAEGPFRIFRLGQWYEGVDSWLGENAAAIWDGLTAPAKPLADAPTWVGVDVGIKRDSTAVVFAQYRPDGHVHVWARLWVPTRDNPVDVTDVMGFIRTLARRFKVEGVAFDPRFFDVPAKLLGDAPDRIKMVETPQSPERMTPVFGNTLELIKRGHLHHNGDTGLRTHVLNGKARLNDRGFTLEKLKSSGRIDAAVAMGLAVDLAIHARKRQKKPRPAPRGF
jgi:phage terminase large subunit-like protein